MPGVTARHSGPGSYSASVLLGATPKLLALLNALNIKILSTAYLLSRFETSKRHQFQPASLPTAPTSLLLSKIQITTIGQIGPQRLRSDTVECTIAKICGKH